MRLLSLSLIIVVIASILSLGWIINEIYIHTTQNQTTLSEHEIYLSFSKELADTINQLENNHTFIEKWNQDNRFQTKILPRDDFPIPDTLINRFESGEPIVLENETGIEAYYLLSKSNSVLSITLPRIVKNPRKEQIELTLTLAFYAGVTTIILIWIWPLIHNLIGLRNAAKKFGQGEFNTRAKPHRISYIRDIESEFNNMADRIQSLIRDNKLLSRAVSHDLKTPLARLRFGIDALTETENEALREKYARRVSHDLEEMESLIETLLHYARLDSSQIELNKEAISLSALLKAQVEVHENDLIHIQIDNQCTIADIDADKRYISMLTNNVLGNAVAHAKKTVKICLHNNDKEKITLTFEDDGNGIKPEERDNVLKPFWRGTQSREKKGHGMGLAIVARIAEWHDASIDISQSETLGGAKIMITFKRAQV